MAQLDPSTLTSRDNGPVPTLLVDGTVSDESFQRWDWSPIDESLWSTSWPYQLAILVAQDDGKYLQKETYTLPINPESLVNAMPFATVLQATFGGVVENNGGVPLRPIVLTGNLGVVNDRESGESLGGRLFQLGGIAGGTIQAGQSLAQSATALGNGPQFTANLYDAAVPTVSSGVPEHSTGYYQWLFLQRFLESYAEAKKTEAGNRLRLALYIWKEQAAYIVSPELLQLTRTSDKPVEYQYTFKATAFARVNPSDISGAGGILPASAGLAAVTTAGAKSGLANALNTIQRARSTVKKFKNLAVAVNADFEQTVGGTLRSVGLLLKDAVGAVKTWADFPESIKNTAYRIINENAPIFKNLLSSGPSKTPSSAAKLVTLTVDTTSIDDLPVDSLSRSTPELRRAMARETARVRALTTHDFQEMRAQVEGFNSFFAAKVGVGDPRNANPPPAIRQATDDDFRLMNALAESTDAISQMTVVQRQQPETSLLDYVAGLASAAGINMRRALSKFAVPFPYGSTLEQLALQYLGDAARWDEIAALNELKQPYIDEEGQDQLLLANGSGNTIAVADGSLLRVDRLVVISSKQELPEQRRVVAIDELAPGYWSVTLSGHNDLDRFRLADQASIHFFLPNTVNSGKVIFIPSEQATTNTDIQLRFVPTLTDLERILQVGGVDGALTDSGDIAITQDGNWPYVQGMAALIQWARIALNTPLRSWILVPNFGIDIQVGQSLADVSAADILASVKTTFKLNSAFTGVNSALISTDGPVTQVTLELGVRGVDATLPVTFDIAQ
jgi:hypothetical protein